MDKVLMLRNHVKIAFYLLFGLLLVFAPKPSISDIIAFVDNISNGNPDLSYFNWLINNPELALVPFAVCIGALSPDIDLYWKLKKYHRKLLHNFFAVAITTLAIISVFAWYGHFTNGLYVAGAFSFGCLCHIGADCVTPFGTWLFWPVSKFALRGPINVGTWEEHAIMRIIKWVFIVFIVGYIAVIYIMPQL
jgi:membrane-bound metal-dependent hydrolase YbcI (DUF457 family)